MTSLQNIKSVLSEHKSKLFRKYPLQSLAIFGSYVRNEQTPDSDVDILVEFSDKIGIKFIDLANELEEIVGVKVDVVSKKGIQKKYLNLINSELIYV